MVRGGGWVMRVYAIWREAGWVGREGGHGVHAYIWRETGWVGREGNDGGVADDSGVVRFPGRVVRVRRGCSGIMRFVS